MWPFMGCVKANLGGVVRLNADAHVDWAPAAWLAQVTWLSAGKIVL